MGSARRVHHPEAMQLKYLPLLVLGLLPAGSGSTTATLSDIPVSETETSAGAVPRAEIRGIRGCDELREAEAVLAEQEVRLLDHLASPTATPEEKVTWKGELASSEEFLGNIDRALEALSCPRS